MFLKFDVSPVLAGSPIIRCRGVKETKEGVAKLETSLAITSIPRRRATPILECRGQWIRPSGRYTDVYSLGGEVSQINTDNSHLVLFLLKVRTE